MSASVIHGVAVEVEVATCRVDVLGYFYCGDCPTKHEVDSEWEITKIYTGQDKDPNHPFNCCEICGRNPWESKKGSY